MNKKQDNQIRREISKTHFSLGQAPPQYQSTLKSHYVPLVSQYDSQLRKDRLMNNMQTNFKNIRDSSIGMSSYKNNDYQYRELPYHQKMQTQRELTNLLSNMRARHFQIGDQSRANLSFDHRTNSQYGSTAHLNILHQKPPISNTFKSTLEMGPNDLSLGTFGQRSKSVSRNPQIDMKYSLISNSERILNQQKISATQIQLGANQERSLEHIQSESKLSFGNNYNNARKINVYDDQYVKFIKQHNWEYKDAALLPPNEKPSSLINTEKRQQYNYKGLVEINRLPPEKIQDFKAVHFEIGNQSMAMNLSSSQRDAYSKPYQNKVDLHQGSNAWQQKNKFLLLGQDNRGIYDTTQKVNYKWSKI